MIVFFDIGATLIDGPAETPARLLARRFGLSDGVRRALDQRLLTGAISGREALAAFLVDDCGAGLMDAAAAVNEVWRSQTEGPAIIPGAAELFGALGAAGIPYGFISNIWQPYAESFLRLFGPLVAGRPCTFSYRLGVAKPDPSLYRSAMAATGNAAGASVMIGDSYDNDMAPAIALGMRTIWLLCRPAKEQRFAGEVASGRLPSPDATVSSLALLSPSLIRQILDRNPPSETTP